MSSKRKESGIIVMQEKLAADIYSMWIQTEKIAGQAVPGQFISMYTGDGAKLLPRPISLCEIDRVKNQLRVVYRVTGAQTGTSLFSAKKAGERIEILGPLGNGFPIQAAESKRALLIGGGIGVPPMLELAKQLPGHKEMVMGYSDASFLTREFKSQGTLYIATENGREGTRGNVLSAIEEKNIEADVIYACGPGPMLRAVKEYAQKKNIVCYVSMEERMACGVGACLACVCPSKEKDSHSNVHNKRVCMDGPVFLSREVDI